MSDDHVQFKNVPFFAMSEDCDYSFINPLGLNTMQMRDESGFITVCRYYDEHFIGVGKTRAEAAYDWKAKFHCFFQKFLIHGPSSDKEEELYRLMRDNIDMDAYERNSTTNREVVGTIVDCRFDDQCPRSYSLDGSDGVYEIPPYEHVDNSFMLLKKGDRFRGLFEYQNSDYKLIRILYATLIPPK
ncbi:MAG: hypothetical protein IKX40_02335 [Thermoguttaceae bacterium]|nr:hypothetical protein [Thermoguttaceae bacterium]